VVKSGIRGTNSTIDGLAAKNDSEAQILVWNYHDNLVTVTPERVQGKGETHFPLSQLHGRGVYLIKVYEAGRTKVTRMVRE